MKANNSAKIKARITGDVLAYDFKEGFHVNKEELLFTIDPRPYKAILDQAKTTLTRDKTELAYAINQVKRYKPLANEEYISSDDVYNYQTLADKLKAQVTKDEATIHFARLNLNYCFVKAPFTARTGPRFADPSNVVESKGGSADPTLVTIKQRDPIKIIFAIPEKDLSLIREAILTATHERFRTILMTSFAFIIGFFPWVIAKGAGAQSRQSIGTTVFGGMIFSTLLGLLIIPLLYVIVQEFRQRRQS